MTMRVVIETITPDRAKESMKKNTCNFRPLDKKRVNSFAGEITDDRWELNGESIKFGADGRLIDGQHRLAAIIKANKAIKTVVAYNAESDGRSVDRGKVRTLGQWLSHMGTKNANKVAAAAKMCLAYDKGLWKNVSIQVNEVRDSEIIDFVQANDGQLQDTVKLSAHCVGMIPSATLSSVLFIGCRKIGGPGQSRFAKWFINSLAKGESLSAGDPVLHLRNRLIEQRPGKRLSGIMQRSLLTMGWNKSVLGEVCGRQGLFLRLAGPTKQELPAYIEELDNDTDGC